MAKRRSRKRQEPRDPFEISLSEVELKAVADHLSTELEEAMQSRVDLIGDNQKIDKWHIAYEGGNEAITRNTPWPGAANLHSWIGTEKVDVVRARTVKAIFVDPIWVVEGWGISEAQVSQVEKFHQWQAEGERLQTVLSKVVHLGLVEGTGVLEVAERSVPRTIREDRTVKVMTNQEGAVVLDEKSEPLPVRDERGQLVDADPSDPSARPVVESRVVRVRTGPQYRVISLKNFLVLPGHAADRTEVWGYAKRFHRRLKELQDLETAGVYQNIDQLGTGTDREQTTALTHQNMTIPQQGEGSVEKEIYELLVLMDLKDVGVEQWYVVTLHLKTRTILRIQVDDLGQARYLMFTPFPRPHSVYGYSLIGNKLRTIIAEHTAWRNMISDRSHLVINAPLKRRINAIWKPSIQPWGPGAVMDVRDSGDVEAFSIPDVPSSAIHREGTVLSASERVSGLTDSASGVHPQQDRTLGEVQTVTSSSLVRIDEIIHNLQEPMEELFDVRHEIWRRTLRTQGSDSIPTSLQAALESRGAKLPAEGFDPAILDGTFRGKPHGSVESADPGSMRNNFNTFLTAIQQMTQSVPAFSAMLSDVGVVKAIFTEAMRLYNWENKSAITDALAKFEEMVRNAPPPQPGAPQDPNNPQAQAEPTLPPQGGPGTTPAS
jgi:hypothetical protein